MVPLIEASQRLEAEYVENLFLAFTITSYFKVKHLHLLKKSRNIKETETKTTETSSKRTLHCAANKFLQNNETMSV